LSQRKLALLISLPVGALALAGGLLLALPGFVGSSAHRASVEAFASSLTGRTVSIKGQLSLSLLPRPEITATDIRLSGGPGEEITATALTMDLSVASLLQGQVVANRLDLENAAIDYPWPLPGGPKALIAPTLLSTAHLANATLNVGGAVVSGITADMTTQPGGAVMLSGTGMAGALPVTLGLTVAPPALDGSAAVNATVGSGFGSASFDGTLGGDGTLNGQMQASGPQNAAMTATLASDTHGLTLDPLRFTQGPAALNGRAVLDFAQPAVTATLNGQNLDLSSLRPALLLPPLPVTVTLSASNLRAFGQIVPALGVTLNAGPGGIAVSNLAVSLEGGGTVSGHASAAPNGALSGALSLSAPALTALLGAYGLPPESDWPSAQLSANLGGTLGAPALSKLTGTLGPDHVSGALSFGGQGAVGHLAFDHLALGPLAAWLEHRPAGDYNLDAELTAATAQVGPVKLSNLALDGAVDGQLNIRRATANLYGGMGAGSLTLDNQGNVTAAHAMLLLPQATPLAGVLLPASLRLPAGLLKNRLSLVVAAGGPPNALAISAVARLGAFTVTAAPLLDLGNMSASGSFTLRHPSANVALGLFGLDEGAPWPGPGSVSLRARFTASKDAYGLNDFQLSLGQLTASGGVLVQKGQLSGQIDADTLALPVIAPAMQLPSTLPLPANVSGIVGLRAQHVQYGFTPLPAPVSGHFTLTASQAVGFTLDQLNYAGGTVSGSASVTFGTSALPHFAGALTAKGLTAAALGLGGPFPYPLTSGTLDASAKLAADGFGTKSWLATLNGTASLTATKGRIGGFALGDIASALKSGNRTALGIYGAATHGTTGFDQLAVTATLTQGNCTLTGATLSGPDGRATASGGIDLFDEGVALRLSLLPALTPPVMVGVSAIGPWAATRHVGHLHDAMTWPNGKSAGSKEVGAFLKKPPHPPKIFEN
jgi:uncharacterized protein involved in outer membrane biogenesis